MKKLLIGLFLVLSIVANAATYYVATTGSDSNAGTIGSPWLTWSTSMNKLVAGDVLYIRGGTYTGMYSTSYGVRLSAKNGTITDTIKVFAYPGEVPRLNCAGLSAAAQREGIHMQYCNYWHFKGLWIINVREYTTGGTYPYPAMAWQIGDASSNIKLERCTITQCAGGFTLAGSTTLTRITYLNCDAYKNYDYWDNGGYCNGFNGNAPAGSTIYYTGCRAWENSDDGYDNMAGGGYMTYWNCWAWRNGYGTPTSGDGDGFKLGYTTKGDESGVQRTLYNCISFYNKLMGFDESMDIATSQDMALYNCVSYSNNNDYGFRFYQPLGTGVTILQNNISYLSRTGDNYQGRTRNVTNHNSWDAGAPVVTNADFEKTDTAGVSGARAADGSLPVLGFLKLASTSDLIGAGIAVVGLVYDGAGEAWGTPPSLGAYEYIVKGGGSKVVGTVITTAPTAIAPTYATSGGNVTDDGGGTISARGVCWNTSANPTTANSKTTNAGTTGVFTSSVTGLVKSTTYHIRAYVTNEIGTSYGTDLTFRTPGGLIVTY